MCRKASGGVGSVDEKIGLRLNFASEQTTKNKDPQSWALSASARKTRIFDKTRKNRSVTKTFGVLPREQAREKQRVLPVANFRRYRERLASRGEVQSFILLTVHLVRIASSASKCSMFGGLSMLTLLEQSHERANHRHAGASSVLAGDNDESPNCSSGIRRRSMPFFQIWRARARLADLRSIMICNAWPQRFCCRFEISRFCLDCLCLALEICRQPEASRKQVKTRPFGRCMLAVDDIPRVSMRRTMLEA